MSKLKKPGVTDVKTESKNERTTRNWKALHAQRREKGLCPYCGKKPIPGRKVCEEHSRSPAIVDIDGLDLSYRKLFTTGQVAMACGVAPRTASKWIDSGKLKGYKIPGSMDRRVGRGELIVFMRENGFPIPVSMRDCQTIGFGLFADDVPGLRQLNAFELGAALTTAAVAVAIVGDLEGMAAATSAARHIKAANPYATLFLVCGGDVSPPEGDLWASVLRRPFDKIALGAAVAAAGGSFDSQPKEKV